MKRTRRNCVLLLSAGIVLLAWGIACRYPREGLLNAVFPTLTAQPNPVCPGESVTVEWDLRLPEGQAWCKCLNGSLRPEPIGCVSTTDCPRGEICLDNYCCNVEYCGEECGNPGQVCEADFEAELVIDESSTPIGEETGSVVITPEDDTIVRVRGRAIAGEADIEMEEASVLIHVLDIAERTEILIFFPWICPTTTWDGIVLDTREFVEIAGVRNPGPYRVRVSVKKIDYNGPPVDLTVGGSTDAFNGVFDGEWGIEVLDPVIVPDTDCVSDVTGSDRLADLGLEVTVECSSG
ncbi:MAG: hypothetical protein JSU68_13150 [Phycisphaerales bacterium]|nr:MAG: hypothetical protein JSU68_13150 [Phycisphaerales bacterium]